MFRFTIRDLLWLMVVVALGVGWLLAVQKASLLDSRLRAIEGGMIDGLGEIHEMTRELVHKNQREQGNPNTKTPIPGPRDFRSK